MAEEQNKQTQEKEMSGIFEPKSVPVTGLPLSGTQKAVRFCIALGVLLLAVIVLVMLHNPFMKPVRRYYKALEQRDAARMCDAFPSWLTDADLDAQTMSIYDMCSMVVTASSYNYGADAEIGVKYAAKTAVDAEYLAQLEAGIESQYGVSVRITKGWRVALDVTYTDGENTVTVTEYARVYRVNGRWVIFDVPGDSA